MGVYEAVCLALNTLMTLIVLVDYLLDNTHNPSTRQSFRVYPAIPDRSFQTKLPSTSPSTPWHPPRKE